MKNSKKYKSILSITTAAIILLLFVVISNYMITIKNYNYTYTDSPAVKIIFISDLHGKLYGKDNFMLINKIADQEPDIICLGGDFIDEDNTSDDNNEFLELLKNLVAIAPTYYSYGNHDLHYFRANGHDILSDMEDLGCTVLEEKYVDIELNGISFRIGGIYDYAFNRKNLSQSNWNKDSTNKFLKEFTNTDKHTILLCHRPDCFIYGNATSLWNIDYILCGHTHGGICQIPFVGGFIAPDQGFFPEYDKGEFIFENTKMIISSGLSGYKIIPRLFNSPEITVIEFN